MNRSSSTALLSSLHLSSFLWTALASGHLCSHSCCLRSSCSRLWCWKTAREQQCLFYFTFVTTNYLCQCSLVTRPISCHAVTNGDTQCSAQQEQTATSCHCNHCQTWSETFALLAAKGRSAIHLSRHVRSLWWLAANRMTNVFPLIWEGRVFPESPCFAGVALRFTKASTMPEFYQIEKKDVGDLTMHSTPQRVRQLKIKQLSCNTLNRSRARTLQ